MGGKASGGREGGGGKRRAKRDENKDQGNSFIEVGDMGRGERQEPRT